MEAAHPRENAPTAGQIRSLGLLGKEKETSGAERQVTARDVPLVNQGQCT